MSSFNNGTNLESLLGLGRGMSSTSFVCVIVNRSTQKTTQWISTKSAGRMELGPRKNPVTFGVNPENIVTAVFNMMGYSDRS